MKTIIVTGGASGIGLAIARRFCKSSQNTVVVGDINSVAGKEAARRVGFRFVHVDVANSRSVARFISVIQEMGGIDVLVPNAGRNNGKGTGDTSCKEWDETTTLNLSSVFYTCRSALPLLRQGGSIIITSSLVGLVGQTNCAAYAAAKGGIIAYVKALARELAPRRITVNTVAPGDVATEAYDEWLKGQPPTAKTEILKGIPLGRFASPAEVALRFFFVLMFDLPGLLM